MTSLRDSMTSAWKISQREGVNGSVSCSLWCLREKLCVSFLYNDVTHDCHLFAVVHKVADMTSSSVGYRYYDTCRAAGYYGASCTADGECRLTKTRCFHDRCRCQPGYSFDAHQAKCVTSCSSYGSEFEAIPEYFIDSNNEESISGIDTASCLLRCRQATSYVCRTADVRISPSPACSTASVTKNDVPASDWKRLTTWATAHYQRHCRV
ncbi:hypothetical protein V1264_001026 [Littorina saxatilis]|uniref:Apple domain-containing protein n=2 Tax=Littorina saxatilis TaxID=31220 RepID=A0AAN9C0K3_9CAEN